MPNIHETIEDQTELAKSYASDGAFTSAARVLRGLAQKIEAHRDWADGEAFEGVPAVARGATDHLPMSPKTER